MSAQQYELELYKTKGRIKGAFEEFRFREERLREIQMEAEAAQDLADIEASQSAFRIVPEVEAWKASLSVRVNDAGVLKSRQPFLVLVGPSQFGKTSFARRLFRTPYFLEMQQQKEPDMRAFVRGKHDSIVLDEVQWRNVIAFKMFYQSGAGVLQFARSQCNAHAYSRYTFGIPLVVCCNSWTEDALPEECASVDWLAKNSVVVRIDSPLWL